MEYLNRYDTQIATTFGNHDTEGHLKRSDLRAIEDQYSTNYVQKNHSLIVDDKEAYTIEVVNNDTVTHVLYVIDGGDYNPFGIGDYDFIRPEHVNWLGKHIKHIKLNFNTTFNITYYLHIFHYKNIEKLRILVNIMAFSMNLLRAQKLIPDYLVRCY